MAVLRDHTLSQSFKASLTARLERHCLALNRRLRRPIALACSSICDTRSCIHDSDVVTFMLHDPILKRGANLVRRPLCLVRGVSNSSQRSILPTAARRMAATLGSLL